MNNINIIGRVGGDIELRYTAAGKAVASLNVAVDDGWGEHKKTVWLAVTMWGATAELAGKALQKGDRVGVTGRLSQEEWEDKNGQKRRKTKVICENMHLLAPRRNDVGSIKANDPASDRRMPPPPTIDRSTDSMDDESAEIPF